MVLAWFCLLARKVLSAVQNCYLAVMFCLCSKQNRRKWETETEVQGGPFVANVEKVCPSREPVPQTFIKSFIGTSSPIHVRSEQSPRSNKTKKRGYLAVTSLALTGNFLSSQAVSSQVLSAFMCLTTVFGMGTGGAT